MATEVTTIELATLVKEMRATQKDYFANRNGEALRESKALERSVDALVARILTPQPKLPL